LWPRARRENPIIDWLFIASLEGADVLTGYLPNPEGSRSGVTIATAIDFGHIMRSEPANLPDELQQRLAPYAHRFTLGGSS
jgi:hypothetical protein